MQIKRLEFGLAKKAGKVDWKDFSFRAYKSYCDCYMADIWFVYITWLGDECYLPCKDPECECHKD